MGADGNGDGLRVGRKHERLERQVRAIVGRAGRLGERGGELGLVKRRLARAAGGIDQDELAPIGGNDAIPHALVRQPVGLHAGAEHQRRGVVVHEFFRAGIVGGGKGARLGLAGDHGGEGRRQDGEMQNAISVHRIIILKTAGT